MKKKLKKMKKTNNNFRFLYLILIPIYIFPEITFAVGRMYAPEEGTFDRRKRIVIQNKCRLVKQTIVPGDVVCEYVSQKKGVKNKEIFLGAPGEICQREITCPIK